MGNLVGVVAAVSAGGAGEVFWIDVYKRQVFAQLYGTVELLEADERARIRGLILSLIHI